VMLGNVDIGSEIETPRMVATQSRGGVPLARSFVCRLYLFGGQQFRTTTNPSALPCSR